VSGVANVYDGRLTGTFFQVAGVTNRALELRGVQVAAWNRCRSPGSGLQVGLANRADQIAGVQIGLLNRARRLRGVQVGLLNLSPEGWLPVAPFINLPRMTTGEVTHEPSPGGPHAN
jgi:hypothetical protein